MLNRSVFARRLRSLTALFLMAGLLLPNYNAAHASLADMSLDKIMNEVQERYHIDTGSAQGYGDSMNVSQNKGNAPEVQIFFTPTDPKPGQEVTARALPSYFSNPKEKLYFTWYLKRKSGNGGPRDWKVEAMRKIATNGFMPCEDKAGADDYNRCIDELYSRDTDNDGYRASFGGDGSRNGNQCYMHNFNSGKDYKIPCKHVFPTYSTGNAVDARFDKEDERFWRTDPNDPSTAQNGNKDEANVVGLGQDVFKWNYQPGDKVGVAVEGTSMIPTKYADASAMVMWAFPKKCSVDQNGSETIYPKGYPVIIEKSDKDPNECINDEEDLIDPTEGNQPGNMEVSTSFSPENPVVSIKNDGDVNIGGSIVNVQAFVNNSATDPSRIKYEWKVFAGTNPDAEGGTWTSVTEALRTNKNISNTQGAGLSSLDINLNLKEGVLKFDGDGVGYLKVQVQASEYFEGADKNHKTKTGKSTSIVKIVDGSQNLKVFTTEADQGGPDGLMRVKAGDKELCDKGVDMALCPVVKNQIVALDLGSNKYDTFSWTLNGQVLSCGPTVSSDCAATGQNGKNFFPVTGNPGETYRVTLTASSAVTGKTLTLERNFQIVEPAVQIVSDDENKAWGKYLGEYTDLDGQSVSNMSSKVFQGFSGADATFSAVYAPSSLGDISGIEAQWLLNGEEIEADKDGKISLALIKSADEIDNLSVEAYYRPEPWIRKALRDIWGISELDSDESAMQSSVQIEMVVSEDDGDEVAGIFPKKFFAAAASYVPSSVVFAVRLVLTMALVLFISGLTLSFAPERRKM